MDMRAIIDSINNVMNESDTVEAARKKMIRARYALKEALGTVDEDRCREDYLQAKNDYIKAKGEEEPEDKVLKELEDDEEETTSESRMRPIPFMRTR